MKPTIATITLFCLAVLSALVVYWLPAEAAGAENAPNSLTEKEKSAGWRLLFDGKSTAGWRNYGKQDISPKWMIAGGALAMEERGAGDIITAGQFEWFELSIEYRISKAGNSGIMFRVTEGDRAPYYSGPEIQVQDNQNAKDPQLSGWLYQLYKPADDPKTGKPLDATKPAGEWSQLRIIVAPDKCETYMNGVKYYEYKIGSPDWDERVAQSKFKAWAKFGKAQRGHIALQDHGNPVAFRSIKIREIPAR
jgi:hypothetical protein